MSSDFTLEWNGDATFDKIHDAVVRGAKKAGLFAEGQVKQLTPVDTGAARDSVSHRVASSVMAEQVVIEIGSPLDYMLYLEFGTGEFAENGSGRKGGWLFRDPEGKLVFTKGVKPHRMVRNGLKMSQGRMIAAIQQELSKVGN